MGTPTTNPIRVLLIDDHELFRMGMRLLIESQPGLAIVGEAANSTDALAIAAREQPDIILLDIDLDGASAVDSLPELLAAVKRARVILVTGVRAPQEQYRAIQLGAMGLVQKDQALRILLQAIEKVHKGEVWLEPALVARLISEMSHQLAVGQADTDPEAAKIARLTAREREVITLIGAGLYNNQIGSRLSISEATVSHHLTSIFAKLEVANRFDLVIYAYRHGLAQLPR